MRWRYFRFWSSTTANPTRILSALPTYYVARETRKYVTVALNGDGGDESFAGYERYAAMHLADSYRKVPAFVRRIDNQTGCWTHSNVRNAKESS